MLYSFGFIGFYEVLLSVVAFYLGFYLFSYFVALNLTKNYYSKFIYKSFMDAFLDLLKITIPATLVLFAMYLTVKAFLDKEFQKKVAEVRQKDSEIILTSRLQAYERMSLFLERIMPSNMLLRIDVSEFVAEELHQILLHEIRNEFSHNLSQQIYMSAEAWNIIRNAKEEITTVINNSMMMLHENSTGMDLAKKILENIHQHDLDPAVPALSFIKEEVQKLF
jgi:anaerobic C4-dicarboxylate transporter